MIGITEVHEAFSDWLALPDPERGGAFDTVDLALATVIANRLDVDLLWLFLVAPPSSGKTETLMSLGDTEDVYPLNNLTPATFISGYERKGAEASLLPKVDGKTIVMKDFTSILTMHRDARAEILSQLREIYDGAYSKDFGTGKHFEWRGKVGLLAGVTPVIDREYAFNAALGERFLLSRVWTAPARELARRALEQRSREADRRRWLRQLVAEFLDGIPLAPPPIPAEISEGLCALAEFAAVARSPIHFDHRGDINYIPEPEGPARLRRTQLRWLRYMGDRSLGVRRIGGSPEAGGGADVCVPGQPLAHPRKARQGTERNLERAPTWRWRVSRYRLRGATWSDAIAGTHGSRSRPPHSVAAR